MSHSKSVPSGLGEPEPYQGVAERSTTSDSFVDCQMFFDFKKAPNLKATLKAEIDPEEYKLQLTSQPFPVRGYKRIAVKVVDVYGNESTVVRELS